MKTVRFHWQMIASVGLVLFSSCATAPHDSAVIPASDLPADVAMNKGAGQGMFLFVKVRLENGAEFPCMVDTGAPSTHLPTSLESMLGKCLGTREFTTLEAGKFTEHIYAAPKLFVGNVALVTGSHVATSEDTAGLGMDCLRHYCIQLDFQAGKMRFLDPERANATDLGHSFPLTGSHYATIDHRGLLGKKDSKLLIDTGCALDGYVLPGVFQRAVQEHHAHSLPMLGGSVVEGKAPEILLLPKCVWQGETYTDLIIGKGVNLIGLKFLARHLVTFDFPKGMMYLKRTSSGALSHEGSR